MKKNNKKVLTAVATLGGSVALLVGGAFAWFSASTDASTAGEIVAGSMSVSTVLKQWNPAALDGVGDWENVDPAAIDITDMMPGNGRFYAIEITHDAGPLQMNFQNPTTSNDSGEAGSEVAKKIGLNVNIQELDGYTPSLTTDENISTPTDTDQVTILSNSIWTRTNSLTQDYIFDIGNVTGGTTTIVLEFYFSGTAGDVYQGKSLTLNNIVISQIQAPGIDII